MDRNRRLCRFHVPRAELAAWGKGERGPVVRPWPADAEVVAVHHVYDTDIVVITVRSDSFDVVPLYGPIPVQGGPTSLPE